MARSIVLKFATHKATMQETTAKFFSIILILLEFMNEATVSS